LITGDQVSGIFIINGYQEGILAGIAGMLKYDTGVKISFLFLAEKLKFKEHT
jgi:hypothetical protein